MSPDPAGPRVVALASTKGKSVQSAAPPHRRSWLLRHSGRLVLLEGVLLLAVLALIAGSRLGILVGGLLLVLLLVLLAPVIGGRSLIGWLRLRLAYSGRQRVRPARVPADLVPLAEWVPGFEIGQTVGGRGDETGVISDGDAWSAVLALDADEDLLADSGAELDLGSLADLTVSDDIIFAGIQVITYTVPAPTSLLLGPGSQAARAYAENAHPVPPTVRRTWICLRLDPTRCLAAVERRGAGVDGIHATLRFGLHRVQSLLKRHGVDSHAIGGAELAEVLALTSGATADPMGPERSAEHWDHWVCDGMVHSGQLVRRWGSNPSYAYQVLLDAVAQAPVLFAVTSFTLSPEQDASGGVRLVTPNQQTADTAVGHLADRVGSEVALAQAGGTQVPTMLATVPLGRGVQL
ncbi:type VII secretion protein EccE [Enemella evansiae]|nr:type VII secretion protein EccE [Enemella evansiae]